MASRFRNRQPAKRVPEDLAELVSDRWPITLLEAAAGGPDDDPKDGPATECNVEASFFQHINYGSRHAQEDRPVIAASSCKDFGFHTIGVLDGHDTANASELVAKDLPQVLTKHLGVGCSVEQAYVACMSDLEEKLKDTNKKHPSAGTCCLNCTIAGRFVWCANLGDCRAALLTLQDPGSAQKVSVERLTWLSQDHKASVPSEAERIRLAGGRVIDGRVEGLEPSRTLGDFDVKFQVKPGVISIVPEVRREEIGDGSQPYQAMLICGTDGIWDVLNGQDICGVVTMRQELCRLQAEALAHVSDDAQPPPASGQDILQAVAEDLVSLSIAKGSRDDCTAVVALISVAPRLHARGRR